MFLVAILTLNFLKKENHISKMQTLQLKEWVLKNKEGTINLAVHPPETVFEALIGNKIIENPFYGLNEQQMKWVYQSEWIYEVKFNVPQDFLNFSDIIIKFEGLDTIADIYINATHLDIVNNMFKSYEFNLKQFLKRERNLLQIVFYSPIKQAFQLIDKFGVELTTGERERAVPGIPYLRKAQYSFGWDWGPVLPDIGIWREVRLFGYNELRIRSFFANQEIKFHSKTSDTNIQGDSVLPTAELVIITGYVQIDGILEQVYSSNYRIRMEILSKEGDHFRKEVELKKLQQSIEITIENPHLWWIHDLGKPYLYDLTVSIISSSIVDEIRQKIGIRKIQLMQDLDKWGETFYFLLNTIPIFAKGANWIPIDSFIPRGKKLGLYEKNLMDAKKANMNIIRVWGGGIYEDELFYDLCDVLGILVWQDFPFACAIYPIHEAFLENIKEEFIQNIERLRIHPSLALWCGNNEIEYLWRLLIDRSGILDDQRELKYKRRYVKIFEELIPTLLEELDPTRPYWPSSPSNGFCGLEIGSIHSNSPSRGDSHYWSVWHSGKPFKSYRSFNSRFMSEFGFQAFTSIKTIRQFCPKDQFDIYSPIMENHQKNDAGNKKILDYMKRRFFIPKSFEKQLILSQITQAEAVEYGVEHWRKNKQHFRCMGTLYWQLNDCWPVASWSSIDYYGRWKALHYFAKRFYAPLFPYVEEARKYVKFGVVNDTIIPQDLILLWKIMNSNEDILLKGEEIIYIDALETKQFLEIDVSEINKTKELRKQNIIFYKLKKKSTNKLIYSGFRLFENPKDFKLTDPKLSYEFEERSSLKEGERKLKLHIKAEHISLFTYIFSDSQEFIASDNFIPFEPNEERSIIIELKNNKKEKKMALKKLFKSFKVYSLYDLS
ncbi:MAG: Beta-galactosidase [Promethearchaeota archaeon]|nr:MAG: Beta-galactosidase [Candidatus Lokiarchaeota archaeon]